MSEENESNGKKKRNEPINANQAIDKIAKILARVPEKDRARVTKFVAEEYSA